MRNQLLKSLLAAGCCCTMLSGCGEQKDAGTDVFQTLKDLETSKPSDAVRKAYDLILDQTARKYQNAFQMEQAVYEENARLADGTLQADSAVQSSVLSQWMLENTQLFQVIRNGSAQGTPPFIGLVRMNKAATASISLDLQDPAQIFSDNPALNVQYISTVENKGLKDLDEEQTGYRLMSEELKPLTSYLGSEALIAPFTDPFLYSFTAQKNEDGIVFTITLENADKFNEKADSADPARPDILRTSRIETYEASTDACSYVLHLDADGAITSAALKRTETVKSNGQTITLHSQRAMELCGIASNQTIGYLQDTFAQVDSGSLRQGSPFTLEIPVHNPEALEALQKQVQNEADPAENPDS